jgi:hypothetical protein
MADESTAERLAERRVSFGRGGAGNMRMSSTPTQLDYTFKNACANIVQVSLVTTQKPLKSPQIVEEMRNRDAAVSGAWVVMTRGQEAGGRAL